MPPGATVGALSAVTEGANEPTFCFSVGTSAEGCCGALLSVGALVSVGDSLELLPQAVMVAMPTMAALTARSATLLLSWVIFTSISLFPAPGISP
jgi:hypothetical protein